MPENYEVRVAADPDDLKAYYAVRHEVFVVEQQVPADLEYDAHDDAAVHVLAIGPHGALGAGRLLLGEDGTGILGRLAVTGASRGLGIGVALVRAIEDEARRHGLSAVELHAQTHAVGFYERLGYTAFGAEYEEAGIPHLSMRRVL
ncbi:GNAT family N-acetyltransferase [Actinacidiphila glaucinigra]|uniref:GNAT family N-acetyltransferase n=1 Tax=Actinacidiphila glaucinigra TaxID=235986 RepID=UPI002DD8005A|nr:GNAT family N-acetyltransferase [Actinacidiphila glaucinigra]WSD62638.1 GNAT family N-acetyltransferase [Actinacidiphila glaucinigra]